MSTAPRDTSAIPPDRPAKRRVRKGAAAGGDVPDAGGDGPLAAPKTQAELRAERRGKGGAARPPEPVPEPRGPVPDDVRALWPAYFAGDLPDDAPLHRALPHRDTPLAPFAVAIIPGTAERTWTGRHKNPVAHFRALEPEFGGSTRLAHLLACCCVVLRRDPANGRARHFFDRITAGHGAEVAAASNLRWLTSVCDTFMDVSDSPLNRSVAMTGTLLANTIKIAETERRMFSPRRPWPPKKSFIRGGALFDGVIAYWVGNGDMIENMIERCLRTLPPESPAAPFVRAIIERCFAHDTALGRILSVQDGRSFPLATDAQIAAARRAMRDL